MPIKLDEAIELSEEEAKFIQSKIDSGEITVITDEESGLATLMPTTPLDPDKFDVSLKNFGPNEDKVWWALFEIVGSRAGAILIAKRGVIETSVSQERANSTKAKFEALGATVSITQAIKES